MTVTSFQSEAIDQLATSFAGRLLRAADAGYDEARKVHNGLIDKHPMVVARCMGTADIAAAVGLARQLGLDIAVRGGGHNVSGNATVQGGMMIDLSPMKAVLVDQNARTAWAQGGVTWGEFNRETQLHGLATTGGVVSSTGVAGLTLGGGLGWLMGKHGLALDNLLAAEVVTAEAKVIRASADENPDLFWALRGGGGNFGVVSAFQFQLHPVGQMVTGGLVAHPFEKARDVMHFYRDFTRLLPDEMMAFLGLVHAPIPRRP
jgi:FAD/FMN-containing dehydrogenase